MASKNHSTRNEKIAVKMIRDGLIEVRPDGTIWRLRTRCGPGPYIDIIPRRAEFSVCGYLCVVVRDGKIRKNASAHRVVWQHLFGEIPENIQINHKNGIKSDNRPENLELVTCRENILHAFRVIKTRSCKGSNHSQHKIKEKDAIRIFKRRSKGENLKSIAKDYGICEASVCNISRKKSWKHIHQ